MACDIGIGKLIESEQQRDAIHVAVAPVSSEYKLNPGDHICFMGDEGKVVPATGSAAIGIVDPFLKGPVFPNQKFWMFLYPGSITSLRHDWTHPAFKAMERPGDGTSDPEVKHRRVIESEASMAGITYNEIIEAANAYLDHGEYLIQGGRWEGHYLGDDFWQAFEAVTGRSVKEEDRGSFFSCSC